MLYGFPLSCILLLALSGLSGWRHGEISIIVLDTRIMLNTASDAQWRCPKSSWRAVMAERQACERAAGTKWEVIVVRQKPGGRGDSTAIHHARWLSRRKSITGVRPSDGPVRLASRSLFHSAGSGSSRLVALYLYALATATLPMEVDARLPCSGPGILLHYSGGRAGRLTNGDRSPPGPAGLTCCRSAQSHHLDVVVVG